MATVSAFGDGRLDEALSVILQIDPRSLVERAAPTPAPRRFAASQVRLPGKTVAVLGTALALGLLIGSGAVIWTHLPHSVGDRDLAAKLPRFDRFTTTPALRSPTIKPEATPSPSPLVETPVPQPTELAAAPPPQPAFAPPTVSSPRAARQPAASTAARQQPSQPAPQSSPTPAASPNPEAVAAAAKFELPSLAGDVQPPPATRPARLASAAPTQSAAAPAPAPPRPAAEPSAAPDASRAAVVAAPSARARRDGVDAMRSLRQQW